jgi:hypothetical protein
VLAKLEGGACRGIGEALDIVRVVIEFGDFGGSLGADRTFLFHLLDDPIHGLDGFHWILADGRLGREHNRVGAIPDGVGDVAGFGPGSDGLGDHRFEHLGGGYDRESQLVGDPDDLLLGAGHTLGRQLHAEVSAGDHDAIGGAGNLTEIGQCLRALDLGDETGLVTAAGKCDVPCQLEIAGIVYEAQSQVIDTHPDGELHVVTVNLGKGATLDRGARQGNALAGLEMTAAPDGGLGMVGMHLLDEELDEPIGDEDPGLRGDHLQQVGVIDADLLRGGLDWSWVQLHGSAAGDWDVGLVFPNRSRTDLESLKIEQDRNAASSQAGRLVHVLDQPGPIVLGAMGGIDPNDIGAGIEQLPKSIHGAAARWSKGRDNLYASIHKGNRHLCMLDHVFNERVRSRRPRTY